MDWEKYDGVIGVFSLVAGILFGIAFVLSLLQPFDGQQLIGMVLFLTISVFLISVFRAAKKRTLSAWQRLPAIILMAALVLWIVVSAIVLFRLLSGEIY